MNRERDKIIAELKGKKTCVFGPENKLVYHKHHEILGEFTKEYEVPYYSSDESACWELLKEIICSDAFTNIISNAWVSWKQGTKLKENIYG